MEKRKYGWSKVQGHCIDSGMQFFVQGRTSHCNVATIVLIPTHSDAFKVPMPLLTLECKS
jgi:hypothetical protein